MSKFPTCLKDNAQRKQNFFNSFSVQDDNKRNKVLRRAIRVLNMQTIQQDFVLNAFKSAVELWN